MKNTTQLFKALSDPTRVRIIWLLQYGGGLCVCDLMAVLDLPQSTVSRHLAYLRFSGLVNDQRKGVWMYYRLAEYPDDLSSRVSGALETVATTIDQADEDRHNLDKYLKTKKAGACQR